jgi:23S rRNA pseudouridine1911/1915/1917 synthase
VVETDSGRIDAPIGSDPDTWPHWQILESGRTAITDYRVVRRFTAHSLVEFTPQTGRTHQLRIHSALLGHSIVGDPVYSNAPDSLAERFGLTHHLLHAQRLCFSHPTLGYEMELEAPPPEFWRTILEEL